MKKIGRQARCAAARRALLPDGYLFWWWFPLSFAAAGAAARRGFAFLYLVKFVVLFGRGVLLWLLFYRAALSAAAAGAAFQKIKKLKITLR